jgi:bidirectional [NiFe] hydrogenase diaphorase subunit
MMATTARAPSDDKRWRAVDAGLRRLGRDPSVLIEVLHSVQESFGYLDLDGLACVGAALGVPLSRVYGVATFYSYFNPHRVLEGMAIAAYGRGDRGGSVVRSE